MTTQDLLKQYCLKQRLLKKYSYKIGINIKSTDLSIKVGDFIGDYIVKEIELNFNEGIIYLKLVSKENFKIGVKKC